MAEAIFNHKARQLDQENWASFSAGTGNYHIGDRPDSRTLHVLSQKGIESTSRAQNISSYNPHDFDFWVAMDTSNLEDTRQAYPEIGDRLVLMTDFDPISPGKPVPDPYWGDIPDFEEVFTILDRSMDRFIQHLQEASPGI